MQRHEPHDPIPGEARGASIALGNFDGVHLGHQALIAVARRVAQTTGVPLGAAVFVPHPRQVFQPDAPPFRLQTREQRASALGALGVAHVFEISFDHALTQLTDREFAERVLHDKLGVTHVSVGADFRFGRGRMGDAESLRKHGATLGFSVDTVAAVCGADGARISSSVVRELLKAGDVAGASALLTRPWAIEGIVQRGFARGRDLGYPTLNVPLGEYLRPKFGIYAVRANVGGELLPGVASIGVHPTTGELATPILETHLFDFDGDLYGQSIETQLIAFLRPEEKFDSIDAMVTQIGEDVRRARALLV